MNRYVVRDFESCQKYEQTQTLGEGLTATVYKVESKKNREKVYAMKVINKTAISEKHKPQLIEEIRLQRKLSSSPNITRIYKIYETSQNIYILMELKEGGNLKECILSRKFFLEDGVKIICAQILLTVDYFHKRGVLHRDLKPENILLNKNSKCENEVTVCDFGFAIDLTLPQSKKSLICGTLGYFAPEALRGEKLCPKSDIFSIGSILFNLFTGRLLFHGRNQNEIVISNKRCIFPQNMDKYLFKFSEQAKELLHLLLSPRVEKRPTAEEALRHEWFREISDGIT